MSWIDICALDDIPERGARTLRTALGCVAVFRTGQAEVFAVENSCPHKGGPLSEGIVHGQSVTCPLHNWVFDLNTGRAQDEDAMIATFPLRLEAGRVLIDGARLAGNKDGQKDDQKAGPIDGPNDGQSNSPGIVRGKGRSAA